MKKNVLLSITILIVVILLSSCGSTKKAINQTKAAYGNRCEGVTSLSWQKQIQGADAETTAKIVTEITAAAEADAKKSEDLQVSGEINASIKSDIAKVINQNVTQASQLSDDFWEQENRFGETMCLFLVLLDRKDLSNQKKEEIIDNIVKIAVAHNDYVLNKKKVTNQE
jgi:hypothetical protein